MPRRAAIGPPATQGVQGSSRASPFYLTRFLEKKARSWLGRPRCSFRQNKARAGLGYFASARLCNGKNACAGCLTRGEDTPTVSF